MLEERGTTHQIREYRAPLKLLFSESGKHAMAGICAGLLSGFCNASLIALINKVLAGGRGSGPDMVWIFVGLASAKVMLTALSRYTLSVCSQKATSHLTRQLVGQVLRAPLRDIEQARPHRIFGALTDDVSAVATAFSALPTLVINVALLLGCAFYLIRLSPPTFLVSGIFFAAGVLAHQKLVRDAKIHLRRARQDRDAVFGQFEALTQGIKELKMSCDRLAAFKATLSAITKRLDRGYGLVNLYFSAANAAGTGTLFFIVGVILFALSGVHGLSSSVAMGFVVTTLYVAGPLSATLDVVPLYARAKVALRSLADLGLSLSAISMEQPRLRASIPRWQFVRLVHVVYQYSSNGSFQLGPVDLKLTVGEIVFLEGGNGSGKTTLAKVLTGLYHPGKGELFLDGTLISNRNVDEYRQLFAAIFADCYLFDDTLCVKSSEVEDRKRFWLGRLHLEPILNGRVHTRLPQSLSQGERKRLALLTALIENKPIYVFDEWAAEQDAAFRSFFYQDLLPELRAQGKTVIVITHDERYADVADLRVKLDQGRIISCQRRRTGR